MADATYQLASFGDGAVTVEFDISTSNWRVSKVRVYNDSDYPLVADVKLAGESVFTAVAPAQEMTSWNTTGIQLGWQDDYWNDLTQQWESSGIEMGDYTFTVQWPGEV